MSTVEEKIAWYETLIAEQRNKIAVIESREDFDMLEARFMKLIENEQNLIQSYQTALNILLSRQGMFLMVIIFCFLAAILTCVYVLIAFY